MWSLLVEIGSSLSSGVAEIVGDAASLVLPVGSALAVRMEGRMGLVRRSELTVGRLLLYWVVTWSISVETGSYLALWTAGE